MPLDSLLSLVEKLRERIDVYGDEFRRKEMQTRYALVDPLLRELGWDTENPDLVRPEYKAGGGLADYALLSDGKPIMMVEVKRLDTPLKRSLKQGVWYCLTKETRYFSATDGKRWEIYDTSNTGPMDESRIIWFDLKRHSTEVVCLKALELWRPIVNSGRIGIRYASEWQPLEELRPRSGDSPPGELRFPDNSVVRVKSWASLLVEVTRWLVKGNHLAPDDCPVRKAAKSQTCLVHTKPRHETGTKFRAPVKVRSLHVETVGGINNVQNAQTIIESAAQDPAQFRVRFS